MESHPFEINDLINNISLGKSELIDSTLPHYTVFSYGSKVYRLKMAHHQQTQTVKNTRQAYAKSVAIDDYN